MTSDNTKRDDAFTNKPLHRRGTPAHKRRVAAAVVTPGADESGVLSGDQLPVIKNGTSMKVRKKRDEADFGFIDAEPGEIERVVRSGDDK